MPDNSQADRRGFHLERSVNVGHILTTMGILIAAFTWGSKLETQVSNNAQAIAYLNQNNVRTNARVDTLRAEIRADLRDINAKLDRLIESQVN